MLDFCDKCKPDHGVCFHFNKIHDWVWKASIKPANQDRVTGQLSSILFLVSELANKYTIEQNTIELQFLHFDYSLVIIRN